MNGKHELLFICTGNFYRSRFAEALFNDKAGKMGLSWSAFSRGLAIHLASGDISDLTVTALDERGISLAHTGPTRVALCEEELRRAKRIIALDRSDHRAMFEAQFPDWKERIEYWSCPDIDRESPERCLPQIETCVMDLLKSLA